MPILTSCLTPPHQTVTFGECKQLHVLNVIFFNRLYIYELDLQRVYFICSSYWY